MRDGGGAAASNESNENTLDPPESLTIQLHKIPCSYHPKCKAVFLNQATLENHLKSQHKNQEIPVDRCSSCQRPLPASVELREQHFLECQAKNNVMIIV